MRNYPFNDEFIIVTQQKQDLMLKTWLHRHNKI